MQTNIFKAVAVGKDFDLANMENYIRENAVEVQYKVGDSWTILSPIEKSIKEKIEAVGVPLKDWGKSYQQNAPQIDVGLIGSDVVDSVVDNSSTLKINYGIKTGCNDAFIIKPEIRRGILTGCNATRCIPCTIPRCLGECEVKVDKEHDSDTPPQVAIKTWSPDLPYAEQLELKAKVAPHQHSELELTDHLIRPILKGRDIHRGGYKWAQLWVIAAYPTKNLDISYYPSVEKYFVEAKWDKRIPDNAGKLRLEQTGKKYTIDGVTFNARKKTGNKWFETQDQIAYMDDFDRQKICFSRMSGNEPSFAMDEQRFLTDDTGYIITGSNLEYLYELLISDIIWFALKRFYMGGGIDKEFKVNNLEKLHIPLPNSPTLNLTQDEINFISSSVRP